MVEKFMRCTILATNQLRFKGHRHEYNLTDSYLEVKNSWITRVDIQTIKYYFNIGY